LWVGSPGGGGLARRGKDGNWQSYSRASTQGGLPDDDVLALAAGADGSLWASTRGGLVNLNRPLGRTLRIVDVIGKVGEVAQAEQTIAITAFDDSYLTQPGMFHYLWRLSEIGLLSTTPRPEIRTRSPVYRAIFPHDEAYQLRVVAVDRYSGLRDGLLTLWLGAEKGAVLSRRIVAEDLSQTVVSGYDLRLLADLAAVAPERAALPDDRVALYRAMLARASGPDGRPLRLEGLEQVAWTMMVQRRRRILPNDEQVLGVGTLHALEREGLGIVRSIGAEREFRHDQMRAFLAALWLVEETPNLRALQKTAIDAGAFGLNRRDQEEFWGFIAPLLTSTADLEALWLFANDDPIERSILLAALQAEADKRGITLVRVAQQHERETTGA
jgi:hypothetical protein